MKSILRIFKYARRRIIALALENRKLKARLEIYQAIIESDIETKQWNKVKSQNIDTLQLIKKNIIFIL